MEPGNADGYSDLTINYISGLSPELKLYDEEGLLMEKMDISTKSTAQLHELMQEKGFYYEKTKDESDEDLDILAVDEHFDEL